MSGIWDENGRPRTAYECREKALDFLEQAHQNPDDPYMLLSAASVCATLAVSYELMEGSNASSR